MLRQLRPKPETAMDDILIWRKSKQPRPATFLRRKADLHFAFFCREPEYRYPHLFPADHFHQSEEVPRDLPEKLAQILP